MNHPMTGCLIWQIQYRLSHYSDVIMSTIASLITGVSIVYWTVCSDADQRKHQSSALLAFVRGIHQWPVNSPHKGPVTRKIFSFNDVIMISRLRILLLEENKSIHHLIPKCINGLFEIKPMNYPEKPCKIGATNEMDSDLWPTISFIYWC